MLFLISECENDDITGAFSLNRLQLLRDKLWMMMVVWVWLLKTSMHYFHFFIRMLHLLKKGLQICSVCVCEGIVFSDTVQFIVILCFNTGLYEYETQQHPNSSWNPPWQSLYECRTKAWVLLMIKWLQSNGITNFIYTVLFIINAFFNRIVWMTCINVYNNM